MLFNVESDTGDSIVGYLVPDTYSGRSVVAVSNGEKELLRFQTNELRQSLVDARRHETGVCGFTLDRGNLPQLASLDELIIADAESGVVLYRRHAVPVIGMRILRLETHLLPLRDLNTALEQRFRYAYTKLERLGRETIEQIFHLNHADSFYASGRLLLRQFEHLTSQTKMVTLLRNPHYELAERLLILNRLSEAKGDFFGARDSIVYEDAVDFAANLDFKNEKVLRRSLRSMPDKVAELLSNPLVRCLTAQNQEETLYAGSIPAALDTLASFAVVGLRSHSELFIDSLGTLLGITADDLPRIGEHKMISDLGEMLCRIGAATDLIDRDLELYGHVIDAFSKSC